MANAAVYARVSTRDQEPDTQRDNLLEYARDLDVDTDHVLADKLTETDTDRAGYRELMELVEDEGWSHRKVSRHSRVPRRTVPDLLERKDLYLDKFDVSE
ncbi:recombinase family protein [Halorubrum sp. DTA46]|uniref:recombinase family protein n=1 Tax=Halorubrum sp. DTA46 TaxID=3402162 RepID=UPI003AAC6C55